MGETKNPAATISIEDVNAFPYPSAEVDLTEEERSRLEDPEWITEDEADGIVCDRREREANGESISLEDVLKRFGYDLEA